MLHETVPVLIGRVKSQVGKPNVIEFPDLAITVFHESSMLHWTWYNYAKNIYKFSSNRPVNNVLIFHHHQNILYNSSFGISYNMDTLLCPSLFAHYHLLKTWCLFLKLCQLQPNDSRVWGHNVSAGHLWISFHTCTCCSGPTLIFIKLKSCLSGLLH